MSKESQKKLVLAAQQGDLHAQQQLWRANRRWIAAIVIAHRPRAVEVDDLMQDVAVKMVSKLDTLREPAAFRPWLRQIVINVCRGAARGLKPTLRLSDHADDQEESGGVNPVAMPNGNIGLSEAQSDDREAARRLLAQVETLPQEYREPLLLRCVQHLTYLQISEILDLPVTTIETRLARARRMLREEVGDQVQPQS